MRNDHKGHPPELNVGDAAWVFTGAFYAGRIVEQKRSMDGSLYGYAVDTGKEHSGIIEGHTFNTTGDALEAIRRCDENQDYWQRKGEELQEAVDGEIRHIKRIISS